MGYTHYWTQQRNFTVAEWAEVSADIGAILKEAQHNQGIALADCGGEPKTSPVFTAKDIGFNGLGDDSHETMLIRRVRKPSEYEGDRVGWEFCKTAQKPYDLAVTACLSYLSTITRKNDPATGEPIIGTEAFSVSSDGDASDWVAGVDMARKALPRYANQIDIPMDILKAGRWCAPWVNLKDSGTSSRACAAYEVHFCVDGCGYVLKPKTGESHCFPTHADLARWLQLRQRAVFKKGGHTGFGGYGKIEEDIWNSTGGFDKARHDRIGNAQAKALANLFPVPPEHAKQPPAYVRPGEMPDNSGRQFCYSLRDLLNLANKAT